LKKRTSRRKIRSHNKDCDEDSIIGMRNIKYKIKDHWASSYSGPSSNIPHGCDVFEDMIKGNTIKLNMNGYPTYIEHEKWNNDGSVEEIIDRLIKEEPYNYEYLNATKKQIKRRGEAKKFYGHVNEKIDV